MTSHIQPEEEGSVGTNVTKVTPHWSTQQPKASWEKSFDKKFLYWVVLGSTLNDGSELRWNVGEGKMPDIKAIKAFISQAIAEVVEAEELKYLRRFEQKADEVRNNAILEERRRIVSRIEEEKSKGYEANTIL